MPDLIRTLSETVHYPPHPPRKPTALYTRTHHRLVQTLDSPCLVCGVRNSTLGDPLQNRWGATQLETHHKHIEDSLALAIDLDKFNTVLRPGLLRRTQDESKYNHVFTQAEMEEWIHGDEDNLWVICDVHHRHTLVGIHAITAPIWGVQNLIKDDFDLTGYTAHSPEEANALTNLPQTTGSASFKRGKSHATRKKQTTKQVQETSSGTESPSQ